MAGEIERAEVQRITETGVIESITRADIDMQIRTAKSYPRDIMMCLKKAKDLATVSVEVAESCGYSLPKTDKEGKSLTIDGPSVRLAEILAQTWTNLRVASRIIEEGRTHVVAQGICHDLETNVAVIKEVRRSIVKNNGMRYGPELIAVTCNAASSIAFRNAVFNAIPKSLYWPVYEAAMDMTKKDVEKDMKGKTDTIFKHFKSIGIGKELLLKIIEREKKEDLTPDDVVRLRHIAQAIKDGDTTVKAIKEEFAKDDKIEDHVSRTEEMAKQLFRRDYLGEIRAIIATMTTEQKKEALDGRTLDAISKLPGEELSSILEKCNHVLGENEGD